MAKRKPSDASENPTPRRRASSSKKTPVKPRAPRKLAGTVPAAPAAKRPKRVSNIDARVRTFAIEAARLANASHLTDVLLLDVRGLSQITEYLVLATGVSNRQIQSVGEDIAELAKEHQIDRLGREVDDSSRWYIIDLGAVMVHLFDGATRAHYDIEMLWGDAPRIRWRRTPTAKADAEAGE